MNLAGVGQLLQGIGIAGILVAVLWMIGRGAYVTRGSHEAVVQSQLALIAEMAREIDRLEGEVARLQSALAVRGDD